MGQFPGRELQPYGTLLRYAGVHALSRQGKQRDVVRSHRLSAQQPRFASPQPLRRTELVSDPKYLRSAAAGPTPTSTHAGVWAWLSTHLYGSDASYDQPFLSAGSSQLLPQQRHLA